MDRDANGNRSFLWSPRSGLVIILAAAITLPVANTGCRRLKQEQTMPENGRERMPEHVQRIVGEYVRAHKDWAKDAYFLRDTHEI